MIKYLVVLPSWIGDIIISQSLLKKIKKLDNDSGIDVIVKPDYESLVKLMPEVNNVFLLNVPHGKFGLNERITLAKKLEYKYDQSLILPNSFKSALIPWLSKTPVRVGYASELRQILLTHSLKYKKHSSSMTNRYLKLINEEYEDNLAPKLQIDPDFKQLILERYKLDDDLIVCCPDAEYGSAKRWPSHYWRDLVMLLNKDGHKPVILGRDSSLIREIFDNASSLDCHMLIGKTQLIEAIYILSSAKTVITNDSGLMHIAAAVESKKLISLFGSSSPSYTAPLSSRQNNIVVYKDLSCSPCFKRECPLGHFDCMIKITPNEIYGLITNNFVRAN